MKALFLAPEPFYQERGTPIAVRLLVEELARHGWQIDLLTYHEGSEFACPNVRLMRIPNLRWVRNVRPGFSVKKLLCDIVFFREALRRLRRERYDYIHAVEEAGFMACLIHRFTGIPYVYDMDSSIPEQIRGKRPSLIVFAPLLAAIESAAIRRAAVVLPVCNALEELARRRGAREVLLLRDTALGAPTGGREASKQPLPLPQGGSPRFLYVGNLEPYQGIDLLLSAFARTLRSLTGALLLIVGGSQQDIEEYRAKTRKVHIESHVAFVGPLPVSCLPEVMAQADVLVSPRITGRNTPMKIYSYLQSGKPILATDMPAHREVLTPETALLVPPEPEKVAEGLIRLATDPRFRTQLEVHGRELAEGRFSPATFRTTVAEFCRLMETVAAPRA